MEDVLRQIATQVGEVNGKLDGIGEKLKRHEYAIYGNGTPGLHVRMDRVEQTAEQAVKGRKAFWSMVLSVLGFIGTAVVGCFKQ